MDQLQVNLENKEDIKELQSKEKYLRWEIYQTNRKEEESWRIKSWSLWIQVGDRNTTFFHNQTKARRINNPIDVIKGEGNVDIEGQDEIKEEAHQHFKILLTKEVEKNNFEDILRTSPKLVFEEENATFTISVEEENLKRAIWNMHLDKAPRAIWIHHCLLLLIL